MRCNIIRNVIHTKSIYFVSNKITFLRIQNVVLTEITASDSLHGISELRYLFVRISGNGYLLNLRASYLLHL